MSSDIKKLGIEQSSSAPKQIEGCFLQMALSSAISFIAGVMESEAFAASDTENPIDADEDGSGRDSRKRLEMLPIEGSAYTALSNKMQYIIHHFDIGDSTTVSEAARLLKIVRAEAIRKYKDGKFSYFGGEAMEEMLATFDSAIYHCENSSLVPCEHDVNRRATVFFAQVRIALVIILGIVIASIIISRG